jgi:hypothetical protein
VQALATASEEAQGHSPELNTAVELYGRIKEGVHVAGYTLERAWSHLEWLLDEDHWREVGEFADVNAFLDSIPLDSFRIVAEQRKRIAKRIKELQPEASTRAVGKLLGAHHSTVAKDVVVGNPTAPRQKTQDGQRASVGNPTTAITGADAAKMVGRAEAKADSADRAAARREALRNAEPLADGMELRIGDCRVTLGIGRSIVM